MSKTKILILGSNGMLGSDLVKTFRNRPKQYTVIPLTKKKLDIRFSDRVSSRFLAEKPDVVINAAAFTNVEDAESNILSSEINATGAKNVAQASRQCGAKLIHFSTDYVFNGENGQYNEDSVPSPINAYGHDKYTGEQFIQVYGSQFYIIRTSWLYGLNGKNFVDTMISLTNMKEVNIICDQIGKPTYTLDLAMAVEKLLNDDCDYGIYHLVNEGEMSWADFARMIFNNIAPNKMKVNHITSEQYPTKAKRPKNTVLLNTKRPLLRSVHEALEDYLFAWTHSN
ncbi:MAG: dTDP-4-dehydrorhamnose reductase [Epsilonproteobacteria bacterium]|nr:dTDP-4-dehydrorhamnose reductase [Campylobacterota bacterium]